jgi:hypothetical protein
MYPVTVSIVFYSVLYYFLSTNEQLSTVKVMDLPPSSLYKDKVIYSTKAENQKGGTKFDMNVMVFALGGPQLLWTCLIKMCFLFTVDVLQKSAQSLIQENYSKS